MNLRNLNRAKSLEITQTGQKEPAEDPLGSDSSGIMSSQKIELST